ncbi:fatty acid desaturase 4, chloroplastic-like protein [Tanacetum coccineum]
MYTLPQNHRIHHAAATGRHNRRHDHHVVYCAATTPIKTRPKLEPLVIKTTPLVTPPKSDDPSLKSTWSHRAWVATGCTSVLASLASSIVGSYDSHIWVEPVLSGFVGYLFADLGSGVYHWGIDNYGDASTPIVGSQIDAFQGHHKWPWTITKRQFANNLHALAREGYGSLVLPQFHAWAHGTKSKLPPLVVALQDSGVLVSRSEHGAHHRPPYNNNYCIVSGVWNKLLDENKVFEALEMVIFFKFGLRPRSWSEPNSDWTEARMIPLKTSIP